MITEENDFLQIVFKCMLYYHVVIFHKYCSVQVKFFGTRTKT